MNIERLMTGVGMTFAASVLLPMLKGAMTPAVSGSVVGATFVGDEVRKRLSYVREEMEDFMAEVAHERGSKSPRSCAVRQTDGTKL